MTEKDKKNKLLSYKMLLNKLETVKDEYETLKNKLITPSISQISDMPKGSSIIHDKEAEGLMTLIEIEKNMIHRQQNILEQMEEINNAIDNLKNDRLERLLFLRYKKGKTWDEIAIEMDRTVDTCYKLHGKALQTIKFCKLQ